MTRQAAETAAQADPQPVAGPRVIWNRTAGSKAGLPTNGIDEATLRDLLRRHGLGDAIVATDSEEAARRAVRAAIAAGSRPIVAVGGDGTAYLIADELIGTQVPLGILPLGSAMNLARSLGIPRDLEAAAAIVAAGHERVIDVGDAGGRPFYEAVSVGLSAQILAEAHALDEGHYRSVLELIGVLRRAQRRSIRLRIDDRALTVKAMTVVVANAPYSGLGLTLAPNAQVDDGLLDVRVFRHYSRMEFIRHFWSISFGRRSYAPEVADYRARTVSIETAGLACRADDFDLGRSPLELRVHHRALHVLCPLTMPVR